MLARVTNLINLRFRGTYTVNDPEEQRKKYRRELEKDFWNTRRKLKRSYSAGGIEAEYIQVRTWANHKMKICHPTVGRRRRLLPCLLDTHIEHCNRIWGLAFLSLLWTNSSNIFDIHASFESFAIDMNWINSGWISVFEACFCTEFHHWNERIWKDSIEYSLSVLWQVAFVCFFSPQPQPCWWTGRFHNAILKQFQWSGNRAVKKIHLSSEKLLHWEFVEIIWCVLSSSNERFQPLSRTKCSNFDDFEIHWHNL